MKLLIRTAKGKAALIAFLISFAIYGWSLDVGPSDAITGQEFIQTIDSKNRFSDAGATSPPPVSGEDSSRSSVTLRKRSANDVDYKGRPPTSATMMRVNGVDTYVSPSMATASALLSGEPVVKRISIGLLLPHTTFKVREYSKAVQTAMTSLKKQDLSFLNTYRFQVSDIHTDMLKVNPSPTGKPTQPAHRLIKYI